MSKLSNDVQSCIAKKVEKGRLSWQCDVAFPSWYDHKDHTISYDGNPVSMIFDSRKCKNAKWEYNKKEWKTSEGMLRHITKICEKQ